MQGFVGDRLTSWTWENEGHAVTWPQSDPCNHGNNIQGKNAN